MYRSAHIRINNLKVVKGMSSNFFTKIDDEYETKMVAFEIDCNDGKGDAMSCHQVGEYFSIVKEEYEKSAKVFETNCKEKNYSPSCYAFGKLVLAGKGVPQDDSKAEVIFDKACKDGNLPACYHQGMLMFTNARNEKTEVIDKNLQGQSLKIMENACLKGQSECCFFLGTLLIRSEESFKNSKYPLVSESRNPAKAMTLFEKACKQNHGPSCFNLAVMFKNGDQGVDINEAKFNQYRDKTNELIKSYGGLGGTKTN